MSRPPPPPPPPAPVYPIPTATLNMYRGYGPLATGYTMPNLRGLQQLNKNAADTLKGAAYLDGNWKNLTRDGKDLALIMENRLNNPRDGLKKQLYCDARKWINAEPDAWFGVRRQAGRIIYRRIEADEGYYIRVEYWQTVSGAESYRARTTKTRAIPDQHYFNLLLELDARPLARGGAGNAGLETVQLAHISIFTNVDPVEPPKDRWPGSYTALGFMHLKDNLSQGQLQPDPAGPVGTVPQIRHPDFPSLHRKFVPGKKAAGPSRRFSGGLRFVESRFYENYRRYFIHIDKTPGGAPRRFIIGIQGQSGAVSQMATTFAFYAVQVLQEYFDGGFDLARVVKTPKNYTWFYANVGCASPGVAYSEATDIGRTTDIPEPANKMTLPFTGGKKKTQRQKKNRRQTKSRSARKNRS